MGLSKNRKGSGIILTSAFAVPTAMSLAQQGVVSANLGDLVDETAVQSLLRKVLENKWGKAGVLTVVVFVLIASFVLFKKSKIGSNYESDNFSLEKVFSKNKNTGITPEVSKKVEDPGITLEVSKEKEEALIKGISDEDVLKHMTPQDRTLYQCILDTTWNLTFCYLGKEGKICLYPVGKHILSPIIKDCMKKLKLDLVENGSVSFEKTFFGVLKNKIVCLGSSKILAYKTEDHKLYILDKQYKDDIRCLMEKNSKNDLLKGEQKLEFVDVLGD